jgi:TonB-linked SusC/RagA family outer membrane protein
MDLYHHEKRIPIIHLKFLKKTMIITCLFILASIFTTVAQIKITGKVSDYAGDPIPGVSVGVRGIASLGTASDVNGEFSISVPSDTCVLQFHYLGFESQNIEVKNKRVIAVVLRESTTDIEEVTVVAFAKQKKESVLGSITTIAPGKLKVPSSNLTTAFSGRVAGLISYQQSGEPGNNNASFFIRGITSFGAQSKKDPLILIDGMELTTDELARLNTDDIASFSVMKDATATALYGARGANGVIYVTTKEGTEGKVAVNVRLESSYSSATKKIDIADPVTFMNMHNESVKTRNPNGLYLYSPEQVYMTEHGLYPYLFPAVDWYQTMFRDVSPSYRANISLSGGGAIARYYVAANVTQDYGNQKVDKKNNFNSNINLLKLNIRSNININLTKTTELILRMNASLDSYTGPINGGDQTYNQVMRANPVLFQPYYEPDAEYAYAKHILFGNYGDGYYVNPYAEAQKGYRDWSQNLQLVQFEGKQKLDMITQGLTARIMINLDRKSSYDVHRQYFPFFYDISSYNLLDNSYKLQLLNPGDGTEFINYIPWKRQIENTFYLEAATEYNRQFKEVHNLNALLVYTMRDHKVGIADNLQLSLPNRNLGVSGRLAYNYDTRYFGELNFGYNGSERFSKKHRFGFFPSVGGAWMVSNEGFFSSLKDNIPTLKLKATYGLVGNDGIGSDNDRFYYLSQVDLYTNKLVNWGTQMNYNPYGVNVRRYPNDEIGWEKSYKSNLGLELTLKNGLSTVMEVFQEKRENILLDRILPNTMGIVLEDPSDPNKKPKANLGKGQGRGFDMELNYEKSFRNDVWLTGRGTFTFAQSKVLEWEEPDYSSTPWLSKVGYSNHQQWGYIAERLFIDDAEVKNSPTQFGTYMAGDIKYRDVNGDGKISALDQVPIGYPDIPEINYGFGLSAGYKGVDFSFFFQGSARQSFWFDLSKVTPFFNGDEAKDPYTGDVVHDGLRGQNQVIQAFADSYWSENNQNPYALWPRLSWLYVENNDKPSTWFMQDASFIRLKSVELGYTLPVKVLDKLRLKNLRIYFSGTNLLCWSGFKLWEPEMAGKGLGYPIQRVLNVGLNIGL